MAEFHQLSDKVKRAILKENIENLKRLRNATGNTKPVKILLAGESGGYGHIAACNSMKKILEEKLPEAKGLFKVKYVPAFPISHSLWNKFMKTNNGKGLKRLISLKPLANAFISSRIGRRMLKNTMKEVMPDPDVVVHAVVVGVKAWAKIADGLGAQYRIVPTDFFVKQYTESITGLHDSTKLKIDATTSELCEAFVRKKITSVETVGYPVRWEILDLAERLRNTKTESNAKEEVFATISNLSKGRFKKNDKTLLIMMGGAATNEASVKKYLSGIAEQVEALTEPNQKLHVFAAQTSNMQAEIEKHIDDIAKQKPLFYDRIDVHFKKFLGPLEVGSLVKHGVVLTKAGGGTVAELATLGGIGVFDMNISKWLEWEQGNFDYSKNHRFGLRLKDELNPEDIGARILEAFEAKKKSNASIPKNTFHLDWPHIIISDLIKIEKKRYEIMKKIQPQTT